MLFLSYSQNVELIKTEKRDSSFSKTKIVKLDEFIIYITNLPFLTKRDSDSCAFSSMLVDKLVVTVALAIIVLEVLDSK